MHKKHFHCSLLMTCAIHCSVPWARWLRQRQIVDQCQRPDLENHWRLFADHNRIPRIRCSGRLKSMGYLQMTHPNFSHLLGRKREQLYFFLDHTHTSKHLPNGFAILGGSTTSRNRPIRRLSESGWMVIDECALELAGNKTQKCSQLSSITFNL